MCQECVDAVKEYWPELPQDQWGDLLMGATAYPYGGPEKIRTQLAEMAERSGRHLGKALALADDDLFSGDAR